MSHVSKLIHFSQQSCESQKSNPVLWKSNQCFKFLVISTSEWLHGQSAVSVFLACSPCVERNKGWYLFSCYQVIKAIPPTPVPPGPAVLYCPGKVQKPLLGVQHLQMGWASSPTLMTPGPIFPNCTDDEVVGASLHHSQHHIPDEVWCWFYFSHVLQDVAYLCPCQQYQLYCASQARYNTCFPKCCSW